MIGLKKNVKLTDGVADLESPGPEEVAALAMAFDPSRNESHLSFDVISAWYALQLPTDCSLSAAVPRWRTKLEYTSAVLL